MLSISFPTQAHSNAKLKGASPDAPCEVWRVARDWFTRAESLATGQERGN
jgi:hypothetical protein